MTKLQEGCESNIGRLPLGRATVWHNLGVYAGKPLLVNLSYVLYKISFAAS
jgi:hypothetical protein